MDTVFLFLDHYRALNQYGQMTFRVQQQVIVLDPVPTLKTHHAHTHKMLQSSAVSSQCQ